MKYKEEAFTLIEILITIVIIGILASLTTASVIKLRSKAQDTKRLVDIRQIQYALERYAAGNSGVYPEDTEFIPGGSLVSKNGHTVYMAEIPHNSLPQTENGCPNIDYHYTQGFNGRSYALDYCLSNKVVDLAAGTCVAMPDLLCARGNCSCEDVAKNCCGWCVAGAVCGGGTLAVKNFDTGAGVYDLIVDKIGDNQALKWDTEGFSVTGAVSENDGVANMALLLGSKFAVADACAILSQDNRDDWYLPAINEVQALRNSLLISPFAPRWSSTEKDATNVYGYADNARQTYSKAGFLAYSCLRRNQ
jgi:prepilin-type N-terminal cleavage/methylation domain-containing protein